MYMLFLQICFGPEEERVSPRLFHMLRNRVQTDKLKELPHAFSDNELSYSLPVLAVLIPKFPHLPNKVLKLIIGRLHLYERDDYPRECCADNKRRLAADEDGGALFTGCF